MKGRRAGWWAATVTGAALVVVTGVARARSGDSGSDAYEAGELIGAVPGSALIPALIAFLIIRSGKVDGYWAVPAVLAAAAVLNFVLLAVQNPDESAAATACEGAETLQAETIVPAPYRSRALDSETLARVESEYAFPGFEIDAVQVVDTRDRAAFVLITATSGDEAVRDVDLFAGFASNGADVQVTELGGRPARTARVQGRRSIVASDGDCSAVTLIGIEDEPTRELAAALRL
ncbi:MAG: hypothetical protein WKF94_18225 [Solirubrobacteraceae bacterium]